MRIIIFLVAALATVSSAAAQQPATQQHPSVALPPDLDRVLRDYEASWRGRDPEGLARLFAEDGFVLQSGRPPVRGRAGIQAAYRSSGGPLHLRALEFAVADSVAYVIGAYRGAPDAEDAGKFVLALRRDASGRWLIAADIDTPNRMQRPGGG